ncbi:RCC1 domain-containing protein 1-like [Apostichopus japonicus]|uniref:RCC1 domain-containing protein 1-like n=1 Tax=Stichopus japonicus TaxID=307972 RepID=UPI003AB82FD1
MSHEEKAERELYACGYNGFEQLPLIDPKYEKSQAVLYPAQCIFCPPYGAQLRHCLSVSWSSCSLNKGKEVLHNGFSFNQAKRKDIIRSENRVISIHNFKGSLFATASTPRNILVQRSPNNFEIAKIEDKDGRGIKAVYLDSDVNDIFVLTETDAGILEQTGGMFIYRTVFSEDQVYVLSCGKEHVLLLTKSGMVFSFGAGSRGQLGHGVVEDKVQTPTQVDAIAAIPIKDISAGGWHSAAVSEYGDLYIWGWNESGQLGFPKQTKKDKSTSRSPLAKKRRWSGKDEASKDEMTGNSSAKEEDISVTEIDTEDVTFLMSPQILDMSPPKEVLIKSASCGSRHTAAVTRDGHLYTWGSGRWGQLGHGNEWTQDTPTRVERFADGGCRVVDVYCREWNTFFVLENDISQ